MPSIKTRKSEFIRQGVFIAPYTSQAISLTDLFNPTTGARRSSLHSGYQNLGLLSSAGDVSARTVTTTAVELWEPEGPMRTGITSDVTTMTIEPQKTNQRAISLLNGEPQHWRILAIAIDAVEAGEIVYARF
ncbi:MAG TPA: hypothetical protein VG246_00210, partial [Acidimicrobiales bacterium]|nr:hypothetical protein [Acidimicrobiales bacterium]